MSRARPEKMHLFPRTKVFHKIDRLRQWRRFFENLWMRDHPQAAAQSKFRDRYSRPFAQHEFQSAFNFPVMVRVSAMRRHQNIHVQQNHRDSIASRSADDELRSIPG